MRSKKLIVLLLAGVLSGCSASDDVPLAEKAIGAFHQQLDAEQFAAIYAGSSADMKGSASGAAMTALLSAVHRKLGVFKKGKSAGWNDNVTTNGHFLTINYTAQYERGTADENFVYRITGGRPLLAGYHINSDALILN